MKSLRTTIARTLRRRRCSKGWTRQQLARRAGVHPDTIEAYETGASCKVETAERIARALGIELEVGSASIQG